MGKQGFDYGSYDINERELEIIRLIANGCSNKEIAAELFLSEGTVRNYLSSILEKRSAGQNPGSRILLSAQIGEAGNEQ